MSARDRIRAVAETLREPRSVNWISEQADAAWSTTNEELQTLADQGQLRRVASGETTRYQPDYTRQLFEEIRTLIEENTREELRERIGRDHRGDRGSGRRPTISRRGRSSNSRSPTAPSQVLSSENAVTSSRSGARTRRIADSSSTHWNSTRMWKPPANR